MLDHSPAQGWGDENSRSLESSVENRLDVSSTIGGESCLGQIVRDLVLEARQNWSEVRAFAPQRSTYSRNS
eukprot:750576-Rhodomonas_salina.1